MGFDCSLCCGVRNQQTGVGGVGGRPIPLSAKERWSFSTPGLDGTRTDIEMDFVVSQI